MLRSRSFGADIDHHDARLLAKSVVLVLHLAVLYRREDSGIDEPERIPLSRTLRLEVPPEPSLCLTFEGRNLAFNETRGVISVRLGPSIEVISPAAISDVRAPRKCTVVTSAAPIPVQIFGAVCHRSSPFSDKSSMNVSRYHLGL